MHFRPPYFPTCSCSRLPLSGRRKTLESKIQAKAARDRGDRSSFLHYPLAVGNCFLTFLLFFLSEPISSKVCNVGAIQTMVPADPISEVQIMRGTHHPSIVKLISFSESLEHYFLVLECQYLRCSFTVL